MPTVGLSPVFNATQQMDSNGALLSGGYIAFYVSGSNSIFQTIYSDSAGLVPRANPIQLSSIGRITGEVWLDSSLTYNVVLKQSDNATVIQSWDNITAIQQTGGNILTYSEWVATGFVPTYVSANNFTVVGNQTPTFLANRRIKATVSAGTIYGTITASSVVTTNTSVTVSWDSGGALDSGVNTIAVGLLSPQYQSIPLISTLLATTASVSGNLTVGGNAAITGNASVNALTATSGTITTLGATTVNATTVNATTLTGSLAASSLTGVVTVAAGGTNSSSGAPIAKAWGYFAYAGTIKKGFNISSISRTSAGLWSVTLTSAVADTNACCIATMSASTGSASKSMSAVMASTSVVTVTCQNTSAVGSDSDFMLVVYD